MKFIGRHVLLVTIGLILAAFVYFNIIAGTTSQVAGCPIALPRPMTRYRAAPDCVTFERADTEAEREQGLSGRDKLARTRGMLFIFEQPQLACLWMKDMKFSLDILWLDKDRRVINIEEQVSPDTYPDSFCHDGTKYVIELNAGIAKTAGIKIGQQINF